MGKHFEFADFVDEFEVPFTVMVDTPGHYDPTGKWIPGGKTPKSMIGIILPLSQDDRKQDTNGRYSEMDRKLYTLEPMKKGQEVIYKNQKYTIDADKDYSDYADVYVYFAKGVSV